jgi:hypothetical protein
MVASRVRSATLYDLRWDEHKCETLAGVLLVVSGHADATVGPEMAKWWGWLNANSAAVTAVVTAVYAAFTVLLWWATKRQATLTQQTFEASHRPYLNVLPQAPAFVDRHIHFVFHLENRGPVPAVVTGWQGVVRYRDQVVPTRPGGSREVVRVVFPGSQERLGLVRVGEPDGLRDASHLITVEASVEYRGAGPRQFSTQITMELLATNEVTAWDCREVRLDP